MTVKGQVEAGAYTGFFPGGGKIQQNITLCARSAHKVKLARAKRARFFLLPPGTFLPPPQRESRVIFPRHFHSKHDICTLYLQSKEKHTFCPTKKTKKSIFRLFNTFDISLIRRQLVFLAYSFHSFQLLLSLFFRFSR